MMFPYKSNRFCNNRSKISAVTSSHLCLDFLALQTSWFAYPEGNHNLYDEFFPSIVSTSLKWEIVLVDLMTYNLITQKDINDTFYFWQFEKLERTYDVNNYIVKWRCKQFLK